MPKRIPVIAGIAATLAIGASLVIKFTDTNVELCTDKGCQTMTKAEYKEGKTYLADKYLNGEEMTFDEYNLFVQVLDKEIKANKGLEIKDYKGDSRQAVYDLMTK